MIAAWNIGSTTSPRPRRRRGAPGPPARRSTSPHRDSAPRPSASRSCRSCTSDTAHRRRSTSTLRRRRRSLRQPPLQRSQPRRSSPPSATNCSTNRSSSRMSSTPSTQSRPDDEHRRLGVAEDPQPTQRGASRQFTGTRTDARLRRGEVQHRIPRARSWPAPPPGCPCGIPARSAGSPRRFAAARRPRSSATARRRPRTPPRTLPRPIVEEIVKPQRDLQPESIASTPSSCNGPQARHPGST